MAFKIQIKLVNRTVDTHRNAFAIPIVRSLPRLILKRKFKMIHVQSAGAILGYFWPADTQAERFGKENVDCSVTVDQNFNPTRVAYPPRSGTYNFAPSAYIAWERAERSASANGSATTT